MFKRIAIAGCLALLAAASFGCEETITGFNPNLAGQDVRLTILHTSDWHSRLIPYAFTPGLTDQGLGLDSARSLLGIGGVERLAYLVGRERARSARSILLDSGDCFQGAPIFNYYHGEPEVRAQSELRYDAVVVGNHEFDQGAQNFINQEEHWKTFPLLAANYLFNDPTRPWTQQYLQNIAPFTVLNVEGLRVGVIGMANLSSLNSLPQQGNSLGVTPIDPVQITQQWVDVLRPNVDLIVVLSHQGLSEDEDLARNTRGIDIIEGGHLHIVLNPPEQVEDLDGRNVLISHSGAFLKYLGRLDLVLRKSSDPVEAAKNGFEVVSFRYKVFPIDNRIDDPQEGEVFAANKDDAQLAGVAAYADMKKLMEPYEIGLAQQLDLKRTVGCAIDPAIARFGSTGGDSQMGNLVSEAMQFEPRVLADFGATNSLGIRDDLRGTKVTEDGRSCVDQSGNTVYAIDQEAIFNVLPFENTITKMFLSGREVQELLDYNAERSAGRGCQTQLQVSGITFTMVCRGDEHGDFPHADDIEIGGIPLDINGTYELATNDYIAGGGSGFDVLRRNTTQQNTYIPMREAVVEYMDHLGLIPCTSGNNPNHPEWATDAYPDCPAGLDHVGVEDGRIQVSF